MKRIIAIIQARTNATRLPGKVLLNLNGKTVLEQVIERVKKSKLVDEIIVATTISKEDLKIVRLCSAMGIRIYCGSEDDVLDRYYQVARLFKAEHIVRITADNPLLDAGIIDQAIRLHLKEKSDYTSNTLRVTFPDGEDVEIFTLRSLRLAWVNARLSSEREHVTAYIKKHPEIFKLKNFTYLKDLSQKRWTLDQREDYKFMNIIYKKLGKKNTYFSMHEILEFLDKHPKFELINSRILRNEGYLKSLKEDKVLKLNDPD